MNNGINERMKERKEGLMEGIEEWMDEWIKERMDWWVDGWMDYKWRLIKEWIKFTIPDKVLSSEVETIVLTSFPLIEADK